jgi:fructokinase
VTHATTRIGVDLGGTKIEAVVLRADADRPNVLVRQRVETRREEGYDHVVAATADLIADVSRKAGLDALPPVGIGMPGNVTLRRPGGGRSDLALVKNSNTTCLNGRPFRSDLARALEVRFPGFASEALVFANDANCFALAEATYGAARTARVAFGVILGTGVGGGVVLRHGDEVHVWDGAQGIAGEWGHVTLDPTADLPCYCGRRGCVEQLLSGPAIERAYARRSGVTLGVAAIASRTGHDQNAKETIENALEAFGRAMAIVIDILDPDVIVLGGGLSNLAAFYEEGPSAVLRWVFNDELRTPIVKNTLGDSAGVFGAALLA